MNFLKAKIVSLESSLRERWVFHEQGRIPAEGKGSSKSVFVVASVSASRASFHSALTLLFPSGLLLLICLNLSLSEAFSHWIQGTPCVHSLGSLPRGAMLVPNAHHLLLTLSLCLDLPCGPLSPHSFSPSCIHVQMELNRFTLGYPTGILSCCFSKNGPQTTCLQITLQYLLKTQKGPTLDFLISISHKRPRLSPLNKYPNTFSLP